MEAGLDGLGAIDAALRQIEESLTFALDIELTILMPCLDEAETLAGCIAAARGFLDRTGIVGEILVADNGSTDGSRGIARAAGARVVPVERRGYGAALAGGIAAARGRFVVMADCDGSYDLARLDPFVAALRAGHDLVMGNRFRGGIGAGAMPVLHRYLGNPVLSFLGRLFFPSTVGDFHCGLRGFRRDAIAALGLTAPGMEFASEMVVAATLAGLRMAEVPTTLAPDGRSRPPHLRSWRDGWRHLKLMLTRAPRWLFLLPGLGLGGTGLGLTAVLLPGPLRLGPVVLDGGSLVFGVAGALVGQQLVAFYGLAKLHAVAEGLLPRSDRFGRIAGRITVDRLCLAGAALAAGGAGLAVTALVLWGRAGFGQLEPGHVVRWAAASGLLGAAGVQAVTTGFLWGIVGERRAAPAQAATAGPDQAPALPQLAPHRRAGDRQAA